MNTEHENTNRSGQGHPYRPEDLSLKGYYVIAGTSVFIGIVVVIGDVSGHGVPSALLMAMARAFIRQRTHLPGELSQVISERLQSAG